jgi:hypothetical protein
MKKLISALVATAFFASCSSTTMIRSTDPQAKIFVDGEYKGVGTATHTDTKIVG